MKALKFKLSGKTAFFKKPEVNSYLYFTYGNIHRVALLGMFGAILGYGGYNQQRYNMENNKGYKEDYPEFYSKLSNLKIAIEPLNEKGYTPKKVQVFNNSVGYASQETGGNLIVKEQWLENPKWNIYVLLDCEEANKISEYIINSKTVYQPYLGKNDHYADISSCEIVDVREVEEVEKIDSLCPTRLIEVEINSEDDEQFKYIEKLPVALDKVTNMYRLEGFIYSNMHAESIELENVYNIEEKNIVFF